MTSRVQMAAINRELLVASAGGFMTKKSDYSPFTPHGIKILCLLAGITPPKWQVKEGVA